MNNETLKILFNDKVIDARQVIIAACVNLGFSPKEAAEIANMVNGRVKSNHRWTEQDKKTLREMYEGGSSKTEIANALGLTPRQIKGMIGAMRLKRNTAKV